ncbi:tRNA (adenosine(37)-N6)-threonylcarbamoyltransferase complex dimerization subunit type 1 TsaB [Vibrio cholerae]|uniref:tRNA (adenosine(37)-N6)-threonylcarbamoyltransferase complex dimerization subunit type 1 TsaB n=1 Tax=Vibrio cholerae TaxID=666 RepID=UPI0018F08258|nr:tRNA (adenosine(37)-N6)-threonylcarbamoyltransferase complex dimerization subunit type 1 TsaB [Vibrio cholerae]MBJ6894267.1 tRNA (adenosine(37)-N6)-threonylcarbamoyltransferase complex dimerization subunit type 1 TsaB [Vibrio cholerae]MBJ6898024.1 tRNA (adenosine(37)-N6)-threonylcarbamoyltransferase complex dimerization subunit type 1 TsaB [Vibrio cholerae]MBJ6900756.1 tRNA (adenosine(37)-N6)-threonylcarbamoyltransferase complex dimerization subunit type 1 TsaB [Vibrio cholerae]MCX9505844.1 
MSVKILALDTATERCSVALLIGNTVYSRSEIAPRDHTKKVLPMVDEVLKEAGVTLQELDALAFGRGPGSFTGVRIGIGIAQGLAFGADLPMIGISTLAAMAQAAYRLQGLTHVASAIDARMEEVYWGRYVRQEDGSWQAAEAECVIAPALLAQTLTQDDLTQDDLTQDDLTQDEQIWATAGTGWDAYPALADLPLQLQTSEVLYPDAQDMAYLAQFELAQGNQVSVEQASPVYLRDTVAWKKLPGRE